MRWLGTLTLALAVGCGGASRAGTPSAVSTAAGDGLYAQQSYGGAAQTGGDRPERTTAVAQPMREASNGYDAAPPPEPAPSSDVIGDLDEARPRYAQADTEGEAGAEVQSDGQSGPLMVYTAQLTLAVHRVEEQQARVEQIAGELGGFLASRDDAQIVIRVPARQFQDALGRIEELGQVVHRNVNASDVTEAYQDLELRIRTLEATHARLAALLERASDVEDVLAVETQLQRVTLELEQARGRLRYLANQVSYSTLTVQFAPLERVSEPNHVLPFPWLQELGLETLMRL